jgi:glutamine amidotransferase
MLRRAGHPSTVTGDPAALRQASKLILPGVGAFDSGMRSLEERGLRPVLEERRAAGVPVLGICLGMQLMARGSEEGSLPGLGWVDADCVRFPAEADGKRLRIPHMGWNVARPRKASPLLEGLDPEPRFYFVHAFHLRLARPADLLLEAVHGHPFPAAFEAGNLLGVQFHPEKSHRHGMRLLGNFAARS